jgi:hypothetical protein
MDSHTHSPRDPATEQAEHGAHCERTYFGISATRIALGGLIAVAAFFLITEHAAHLYGALPFLFLLACPLMHVFHHHGHHHHTGDPGAAPANGTRPDDSQGGRS